MKNLFIFLSSILLFACQPKTVTIKKVVPADTLAMQIDKYVGQEVAVEGKIIHVCPVDGSKMKLTNNRQIIKIIPPAGKEKFERCWNGKRVRIVGKVYEERLSRAHIDSLYQAGSLLCHIDFSPCNDTAWVAAKHRQGKATEIVNHYHSYFKHEMQRKGKDYISVVVLEAIKTEEVEVTAELILPDTPDKRIPDCSQCPLCGLCMLKNHV
ncbi:MAG: hypothetical protein NC410_04565 [Oscillibacter sp.]|nr:hypothetical protein [Oscillibacter sp.]